MRYAPTCLGSQGCRTRSSGQSTCLLRYGEHTMDTHQRSTVRTSDDHPKLEYNHLRREFTRQVGGLRLCSARELRLKPYRRACRTYGQDYSVEFGLELGQTHWILYEYWVLTGGSGCVLTTNSVMIPNDAAAPFDACQSRSKKRARRWEEYARRIGPDCEPHLRVQWYCLRVQLRPLAHGRALNHKEIGRAHV